MNVGQLTATFDIDASGAEEGMAQQELAMRGLQRDAAATASSIRRDMEAALRRLPTLKITADSSEADIALNEVKHQLRDLASEKVGVTISAEEANARLNALQDRLVELARMNPTPQVALGTRQAYTALEALQGRLTEMAAEDVAVQVHADTERARAELAAVEEQARRVGQMDPRVNVHVDEDHEADRAERDFSRLFSTLGQVGGGLAGVAGQFGMVAGMVGSAVPVVAGLAAALVSIAPAAGVAATGILMVASAAAAIKIGTSGIGSAIKAAFADAPAAAGGAASATNQVADAQRSLKDAISNAADANVRAARQVGDAERNLTDAQKSALSAQQALSDARKQAAMDLEDLNNRVTDSALSQREAVLRVEDAKASLDTTLANPKATQQQREQAQLTYDQAVQHLTEQGVAYKRLQEQAADANKAGVDGAQKVTTAQNQLAMAQRNVGDQTRAVADAQAQQAKTAYQGAEQVQKALEALHQAGAGAAAGGVDPLAAALAKLSPNARAFVEEIIRLKPALADLKFDVQQKLFEGMAESFRATAASVLPVLHTRLVETAGALNIMGKGVLDTAGHLASSGVLGQALAYANAGLRNMASIPSQIMQGLVQIGAAAGPGFARVTSGVAGLASSISDKLSAAFSSGGMQRAINIALDLIGQLGTVVGNVGRIIGSVFGAAQQSGGGFIGTLVKVSDAMAKAFATPAVQSGLRALFSTMSVLASTVAPLLGQALQVIGPVLAALGPPVQTLVRALGVGLSSVITALGPVLLATAQAVGQLLIAVSPLLPVLGQLIAGLGPVLTPILTALGVVFGQLAPVITLVGQILASVLAPILTLLPVLLQPFLTLLTSLTGTLLPVLGQLLVAIAPSLTSLSQSFVQIMVALAPVLTQLANLVTQQLAALGPLLPPIISFVGQLAAIFANQLAGSVQRIVIPALQTLSALLSGDVSGAFTGLSSLVVGVIEEVIKQFVLLPGEIMYAIGDLGGKLYDAGTSAISSLIRGVRSKFGDVANVFGDLTDWIAQHKGPPERDARLLTPAGQLLMDGLMAGIGNRRGALRGQLQGITSEISGMAMGRLGGPQMAMAGGGQRGASGFHIEHYYESDSGSAHGTATELNWLSKGRG